MFGAFVEPRWVEYWHDKRFGWWHPNKKALMAFYKFNIATGTMAYDHAEKGNHMFIFPKVKAVQVDSPIRL